MFIANLYPKCCGIGVLFAPNAGSFIELNGSLEGYTFGLASCASLFLRETLRSTDAAALARSGL